MNQRRITPEAEKVYKKYGTAPLMHLTDNSTGEVMYTDRDVSDIAKWSVSRGGSAANENMFVTAKYVEKWIEDNLMELYKCDFCSKTYLMFLENIYVGFKPNQYYEKSIIRCNYCYNDNEVRIMPEDKKETLLKMIDVANDYLSISINNTKGRQDFILEQMKK